MNCYNKQAVRTILAATKWQDSKVTEKDCTPPPPPPKINSRALLALEKAVT